MNRRDLRVMHAFLAEVQRAQGGVSPPPAMSMYRDRSRTWSPEEHRPEYEESRATSRTRGSWILSNTIDKRSL